MSKGKIFAVIGGDRRSAYLAAALIKDGYTVTVSGLETCEELPAEAAACDIRMAVAGADAVILPMPLSSDNVTVNAPLAAAPILIDEVFAEARPGRFFAGGKISAGLRIKLQRQNINIIDYMEREELAVMNCIPTSEGAIALAMANRPSTLFGSSALVIGNGRIGKILSQSLRDLGACVTVSARNPGDLALIRAARMQPAHTGSLENVLAGFDIIFNTVPALVLTGEQLRRCAPDCLIIDLASKPGGVDFAAAGHLGLNAVQAISLPGKVAPKTAAGIIKETILNVYTESRAERE